MLRLVSSVTIVQKTPYKPNENESIERKKTFSFNFINEVEIFSSWEHFTDTAKITFPKKMYFTDENGVRTNFTGKNLYAGDTIPLIQRGDRITINLGYHYNSKTTIQKEFEGYITAVFNTTPITFECEDLMYELKQIQAPIKTYYSNQWDVESMINDMLKGKNTTIKVRQSIKTIIGDFISGHETVAEVLANLRKKSHLNSYLRGNELRCSSLVYYPEDVNENTGQGKHIFSFQENITNDDLQYQRKEDTNLHIRAYSVDKKELETGEVTKKGKPKTTNKRLEVLVPDDSILTGETKTLYFFNIGTKEELKKEAEKKLNMFWFTGFRGKFTTFGLSSVRHGDHVKLIDKASPERNGNYIVKSVRKTFGVNGYRQEIELDIRLDGINLKDIYAN